MQIYPKAIRWDTSIDCQYSSGTYDVCIIRAFSSRNATRLQNNDFCDDTIIRIILGLARKYRLCSANASDSSSSLRSCCSLTDAATVDFERKPRKLATFGMRCVRRRIVAELLLSFIFIFIFLHSEIKHKLCHSDHDMVDCYITMFVIRWNTAIHCIIRYNASSIFVISKFH